MTTEELRNKVTVRWQGYGTYKVTIEYRRKFYTCYSHNSIAYDRLNCGDDTSERADRGGTYKEALQAFYTECKRGNHLGEFNY